MNQRTQHILLAVAVIIIGLIVFYYHAPQKKQPLAVVSYVCNQGKNIAVAYYKGDAKPAATADQPPVPSGSVALILSDGRTMTLQQTVSADGGRYASADDSFVFWAKGNSAIVLEHNQEKSYIGCILVAPQPSDTNLTLIYSNSDDGFSIRLPAGYTPSESYKYQALGPGKDIVGVMFTISSTTAAGTNLAPDSYLSVEGIPQSKTCSAKLFLDQPKNVQTVVDGDITYSVASSLGAAAGNRFDETVYAIPGTNPCIAVRYMIHYGVFENYPSGTVRKFDRAAVIAQFDAIRRTLIIVQ